MKWLLKKANLVAQQLLSQAQYESLIDLRDDLRSYTTAIYWRNLQRVKNLKNTHQGQRCFIIGNGPSLNQTDLSNLANEYTFGLNRIYLLFDKMGFTPTYYVCTNPYVIEQSWQEIHRISGIKFLGQASIRYFANQDDVIFLRSLSRPRFSYNIARGVWEGATVTYCAMQIAFYLGFTEVILIGVDHYFKTEGQAHAVVISEGDDPNHFSPNYFGKGVKWQLPDLATSEIAYKMAKHAFEGDGRQVVDATVQGCLTVFPKVSLNKLLEKI